MSDKNTLDIFADPISSVTIKLAIPIFIGNILSLSYTALDTYFLSLINKNSTAILSGVGLVFPITFLFWAVSFALQTGIASVVGRAIGEKNESLLNNVFSNTLFITAVIGIPPLLLGELFGETIVRLLAGNKITEDAIRLGVIFLRALLPGLVSVIFMRGMTGLLQGEGKAKIVSFSALFITVVNAILDPVLIFYFQLGVLGAGVATSVSMITATVYVFFYLKFNSRLVISIQKFNSDLNLVFSIFKVGFPQFLNLVSSTLQMLVLNHLVSGISEQAMNAWTIVSRFDQLLYMPMTAIYGATLVMVSQNYGRRNLFRVEKILFNNILLGLVLCAIFSVVYIIISPFVFAQLTTNSEVINLAVLQVRVLAFISLAMVIGSVVTPTFQGTGKAIVPVAITFVTRVLITLGVAYILVPRLALWGIFAAIVIGNLLQVPINLAWIKVHFIRLRKMQEYESDYETHWNRKPG